MFETLAVLCPNVRCRQPWEVELGGANRCPHCGQVLSLTWETEEKPPTRADRLAGATPLPWVLEKRAPASNPDFTPASDSPSGKSFGPAPPLEKPPATSASTIGAAAPFPSLPPRLGRFELRRFLAEGAFGRVYEAFDPQLDRTIALKVAKAEQMDTTERVRRFVREARAAANLRHPHIVPVFDAGKEGDFFFIASAIIAGTTLAETLQRERFPIRRAVETVVQLADALAYAHGRGVVHRDVKPANVLIDEHGDVVLTDFGLAFRHEDERLTRDGALMGTPQYMSPEQARGQFGDAQPASDQYSLGVLFYEMLTGQPLFTGRPESVLHQHLQSPPPPPRSRNPTVPHEVARICLRCLEKDPAKRHPDCRNLAACLQAWLGHMDRDSKRASRSHACRGKRKGKRTKEEPATPSSWRSGIRFFLETKLWRIVVVTTIFAAGIAVASWVQRGAAVTEVKKER